jgi:RNA polymerase sigma-70 factor (ECF subfamily)
VLVNGGPGMLSTVDGRPVALMSVTISGGKIVAIDILADPARLAEIVG